MVDPNASFTLHHFVSLMLFLSLISSISKRFSTGRIYSVQPGDKEALGDLRAVGQGTRWSLKVPSNADHSMILFRASQFGQQDVISQNWLKTMFFTIPPMTYTHFRAKILILADSEQLTKWTLKGMLWAQSKTQDGINPNIGGLSGLCRFLLCL